MAKLAEGMTRSKTDYGTVYHMYRGVKIWKRSSGYEFTIEYMQSETGRVFNRDRYAAYQLQNVPSDIDEVLNDEGKYFVDEERNIVRLNPDYLENLRTAAIERNEQELASLNQLIADHLSTAQYDQVEKYAIRAAKVQQQIKSIKEQL